MHRHQEVGKELRSRLEGEEQPGGTSLERTRRKTPSPTLNSEEEHEEEAAEESTSDAQLKKGYEYLLG